MFRRVTTAIATGVLGLWGLSAGAAVQAEELAKYEIVDQSRIPKPLTNQPGDPVQGRKVAINRKQGNCLACHVMPIPEQPFHGETGPNLKGIGSRYDAAELRLRLVNPKVLNADTMMPAFYRDDGFHRVAKKFKGKTILSAQQVEDVIAYLLTLKEQ